MKVRPNDKDAKLKWTECNKIVKKMAFEKAIAVDDCKKSIADTLNIDVIGKMCFVYIRFNLNLPSSYDDP